MQRADFNTLDNSFAQSAVAAEVVGTPAAGLHFVAFAPSSDLFNRARRAMDGSLGDGIEAVAGERLERERAVLQRGGEHAREPQVGIAGADRRRGGARALASSRSAASQWTFTYGTTPPASSRHSAVAARSGA